MGAKAVVEISVSQAVEKVFDKASKYDDLLKVLNLELSEYHIYITQEDDFTEVRIRTKAQKEIFGLFALAVRFALEEYKKAVRLEVISQISDEFEEAIK